MMLTALLCALLVQDQKTPDLFEELRASDVVVRMTVVQGKEQKIFGQISVVFKGEGLQSGDLIEATLDRDEERRRFQATAGRGSWFNRTPERDQRAVFLLRRGEQAWQIRFVLFGGPRSEAAAYQETPERIRNQDDAVATCLEIARAEPADAALLLARTLCEKAFATRTHSEILMLYELGLPKAAKHLTRDSEKLQKVVSTYHPKAVETARTYSGQHVGLLAWFSRLGSEEQRKAIVAALLQHYDKLEADGQAILKRKAERAKEELDFPFEREMTVDDMFGDLVWSGQSFIRGELGAILDPAGAALSFRPRDARHATIVREARDYLKK